MKILLTGISSLFKIAALVLCITLLLTLIANYWVLHTVPSSKVYTEVENIEFREVALLLGTSRSINGRHENPFFTNRIEAAAQLFFAGKVKHILVSGDNSSMRYNEPLDMKKALIKRGIPEHCITMDFAGLRTLDSVVRSKKIFQQERLTIVSQEFHNYRALFIANYYGIDAIAFNAQYPTQATSKTLFREYLARVKAVLDLYILHTKPKYLGDKIDIRV